jgi:3-hydroxyisobutyrate dehydrogenase-like beta-hydroxyacid dehydrogenase
MQRVAFVGLGVMGGPMAGHVSRAGFEVRVHNRSPHKAERWATEHAGHVAHTPAEAAESADVVLSCVGNDADLRAIATGPSGLLAALRPGAVWADHSTSSADVARELHAACAARDAHFLDAPVSGGESGARQGALSVMVGGERDALDRANPVIATYAKRVVLVGPSGAGQLCKMVNQVCIAGVLQGLSEGLRFGERAGLDMPSVLQVISQGAAQSWQMDNRATSMLERSFDFGFAIDWMRKDLRLCLDEAARNGSELDFARAVLERYDRLSELGRGRADTSSLIALLDEPRSSSR